MRARWRSTEALVFLTYYCLFMAYNFVVRESDPMHWLGLVLVPFVLVYLCGRRMRGDGLRAALASVGLRRGNLTRGLPLALLVGFALGSLQLLISDHAPRSGRSSPPAASSSICPWSSCCSF